MSSLWYIESRFLFIEVRPNMNPPMISAIQFERFRSKIPSLQICSLSLTLFVKRMRFNEVQMKFRNRPGNSTQYCQTRQAVLFHTQKCHVCVPQTPADETRWFIWTWLFACGSYWKFVLIQMVLILVRIIHSDDSNEPEWTFRWERFLTYLRFGKRLVWILERFISNLNPLEIFTRWR